MNEGAIVQTKLQRYRKRQSSHPGGSGGRHGAPRRHSYTFTQAPFFFDEATQASTKATPFTPSSTVG
nr:hypothetical protein RKHAN_00635 [Rhizobium sp. Khangiran2]